MKKFLRYALLALLWAAVTAYIIYAAITARKQLDEKTVARMEIEITDSTSLGNLVSEPIVRGWIARSGIPTLGTPVAAVRLDTLERLIAANGFVERADAYVTYAGTLHIALGTRRPLLRLLLDGFDDYATDEGYVFAAPRASSLYVPVVTGSYRPPFPTSYTGSVRAHIDTERTKIDRRIAELEKEKYPFYKRELQNDRNLAALRRMRVKKQWWRFESARSVERRAADLQRYKIEMRRRYRYEAQLIGQGIDRLAQRQEAARRQQKKLEESYADFMKLLNFVQFIEEDDFWGAEVVQIATRTAPSGALEVELIPRSGRYTIVFGRLDDVERKFDKLWNFYNRGLTRIGWNEYGRIDVRYRDQVICSE